MQKQSHLQFNHQSIPTLLSIDAQSEVSVDLRPNQQQPLISKILLLCIELERKEIILEQYRTQIQFKEQIRKSQIENTHRDMQSKWDILQRQNKALAQNNTLLKNNMVDMERTISELRINKQRSMYNKDLEQKIYNLQLRLKKAEQQKIEYVQREKSLKRENSMLSFSANKTSQKNKIRDLQHELSQQRNKLQAERRLTSQLKHEMEKYSIEVKNYKENQFLIKRSYEQKIQKIQITKVTQDLKKSQFTAVNQQKIALLSQQLNRQRDQIENTRKLLKNEQSKTSQLQSQLKKMQENLYQKQQEQHSSQMQIQSLQQQIRKKQQQISSQINQQQISQQTIKTLKMKNNDMEYFIKQKNHEYTYRDREIEKLGSVMEKYQKQMDQYKNQIRKLKRKAAGSGSSQCQICKIRSSVSISSAKNIGNPKKVMDLQQIIKQTQKLNLSNKKIQSLINHHQISIQHSQNTTTLSIQSHSNSQQTMINANQ